ncbi:MAG: response regulator, partial [Candidatus Brocadiae bacterium]|nr:response regulator [Candidatus Brocadiia bacterium]
TPDGRSWFIRGYPVTNARGDVVGAVEVARDITERRRLDARMQQAQKLESLGVLAGGVAHDFNNLLTGVLGNAGLALMDLPRESPARESVEQIEKSARSAAELASQMLAYSGRGRFVVESLNLSKLVREMQHLLKSVVSKKAILKWELADDLPPVEGDATQFRQVIMNLTINASEAIGDGDGVITVRTGTIRADGAYLSGTYLAEELPEGPYVCLEVSDTGSGMDAETRHKVFDPFFSTKFTGRGLGLAAVLGIVRGHRGAIKVYSEPGSGSAFKVLLPASKGVTVEGCEQSEVPATEWHGSGTILVVDDEEAVQSVTSTVLKACGFSVLTAKSGREAIEVMRDSPEEIAAVLLDLTMPGMSAEDVFTELRRIRQGVPIILSSGYTEQDAVSRLAGKDLAGFIQKPYEVARLLAKLREVLEAPGVQSPGT